MQKPRTHGIVVGVDLDSTGDVALGEALRLARRTEDVDLHVVHVVSDEELEAAPGPSRMERQSTLLDHLPARIWDRVSTVGRGLEEELGTLKVSVHVRFGAIAEAILQVAVDYDADLIVVGTHGRKGIEKLVLGSVANDLVRIARCPVLIARHKDFTSLARTPRVEPPRTEPSMPGTPHEPHVYVSTQNVSWHSDVGGATGVRMSRP